MKTSGRVYLVGAGPGDPDLLTLRAAALLREADVVLYDALVNEEILDHCRPDARLVNVGKRGGRRSMPQEKILELLERETQDGKVVVRLKGGDPFVFGRGGEEAEFLADRGIPFEVVPGITAGIAAPAYAGIPATDRRWASSVIFVTGHKARDKETDTVDWRTLARMGGSIIIYMGAREISRIAEELMAGGLRSDTPVAIVRWGTLPSQHCFRTTLGELPALADSVESPSIIIVGELVRLREKLQWFEKRPLFGLRIVVTRPRQQAHELVSRLRRLGAYVLSLPVITVQPLAFDLAQKRELARKVRESDWIVFTSANGVAITFDLLREVGCDARVFKARVCAIGPATARALGERGICADLVPKEFVAEGIVRAFKERESLAGKLVLLLRSRSAREYLVEAFRAEGADVEDFHVYDVIPDESDVSREISLLREGVHVVVFMSPSAVRGFAARVGEDLAKQVCESAKLVSIGPVTSDAIRRQGWRVFAESARHDLVGVLDLVVKCASSLRENRCPTGT